RFLAVKHLLLAGITSIGTGKTAGLSGTGGESLLSTREPRRCAAPVHFFLAAPVPLGKRTGIGLAGEESLVYSRRCVRLYDEVEAGNQARNRLIPRGRTDQESGERAVDAVDRPGGPFFESAQRLG